MKSEMNNNSKSLQENVNTKGKQNSKSDIIGRIDVKGTPFTIIKLENEMFGTIGKFRVTEKWEGTLDELEENLKQITWERIMQVLIAIEETNKLIKEEI